MVRTYVRTCQCQEYEEAHTRHNMSEHVPRVPSVPLCAGSWLEAS